MNPHNSRLTFAILITVGLLGSAVIWMTFDVGGDKEMRRQGDKPASATSSPHLLISSSPKHQFRSSASPLVRSSTPHTSIYPSAQFFDNAYRDGGSPLLDAEEASRVVAFVTPHHLLVRSRIAAMFASMVNTDFDTVVLVSPDHFDRGRGHASLSTATWSTPYGNIEPDLSVAADLVASGAVVDERPFQTEHGITGLVAFVHKSLPNAEIVPLILRSDVDGKQVDQLAQVLADNGKKIFVIASVDFTHEADAATADQHDTKTVAALAAFDYLKITASNVDSPATLRLVARYAELKNAKEFRQLSATHSERLMGHPEKPGTSHVIGVYLQP